jgi:hypothetical protein
MTKPSKVATERFTTLMAKRIKAGISIRIAPPPIEIVIPALPEWARGAVAGHV